VTVTLDGGANDGGAVDGPAETRDNVANEVENISGGSGDDSLTGNKADNTLIGGRGADTMSGLAGNATIRAKDGTEDQITRGAGSADQVFHDASDTFPRTGPDACETVH
jgi:Ca2+-binding RTX toxin-like protein